MTSTLGEERKDLADCFLAGRRAALVGLHEIASRSAGRLTYGECPPHELPPDAPCTLTFNGVDVTAAIDAVVMETIVRLEHPENAAPTPKPRRWWRFW